MTISFNQIPAALRVPWAYIEFDNSRAVQGSPKKEYQCIIMGQLLAAGSASDLDFDRVTSADQAGALYGFGSHLHNMFQKCSQQYSLCHRNHPIF